MTLDEVLQLREQARGKMRNLFPLLTVTKKRMMRLQSAYDIAYQEFQKYDRILADQKIVKVHKYTRREEVIRGKLTLTREQAREILDRLREDGLLDD